MSLLLHRIGRKIGYILVRWGQIRKDINKVVTFNYLLKIREDNEICDARAHCYKMRFGLFCFTSASLQDDLDAIQEVIWESVTEVHRFLVIRLFDRRRKGRVVHVYTCDSAWV